MLDDNLKNSFEPNTVDNQDVSSLKNFFEISYEESNGKVNVYGWNFWGVGGVGGEPDKTLIDTYDTVELALEDNPTARSVDDLLS